MAVVRTTIAGLPIPDSALARDATEFVHDVSLRRLFDHPRTGFKTGIVEAFSAGMRDKPDHLRDHKHGHPRGDPARYVRPNFCELSRNSRFHD